MVCLFALMLGLAGTVQGGFTARLTNPADSLKLGTVLLAGSPATSGCDTAQLPAFTSLPVASCPGGTVLPASTPGSSNLTVTADGTLPTAAQLGSAAASLSGVSCGPVQLLNTVAPTDPMLVRGGVGYAVAGPLTGSAGLSLDGVAASHSLASDVLSRNSAALLGNSFSVAVWFKVSSGGNGPLIGFGSSPNDTAESSSDYPAMWLDSTGKVRAGARSTLGSVIATSSGTTRYDDGAWHLAVMTISSAVLTITVSVYVDSTPAGSATVLLSLATGFTGYWHVGWSPVSVAPWSSGTGNYLKGSLSDAAVFGSVLSAATVANLAGSGSQTTWLSRIGTAGANSSWPLSDDGTSSYAGTLPVVGNTSACSFLDLTIGGSGFCIYPNSIASSCAAPASKLSALASSGPLAFPAIQATASTVLTSTTKADASYAVSCSTFCPGLHLLLPVSITESYAGLASTLSVPASQTVI
ncbi:MAG: LamG domain-containing protein [Actinomycetota bacterium]|nr:LamG domain-containing protein [Actinomycetota bacterium]MDQ2958297.1 LamG domain-containing protein [Actinomycetota bacterium]